MELRRYRDTWYPDDRNANFKAEVACYTAADPLPTIENLSKGTGIPVDTLIRYILVKYVASGSEAILSMEPLAFRQMKEHVQKAEEEDTDAARLRAYTALRDMISWLGLTPA